jgi:hypothetical protein
MRLAKGKFEQWLRAKQPAEIVGHNRDCHSCPIAEFYSALSGGGEIVIFEDANHGGYIIDRGYSRRPAPPWAERFISEVDGDADGKISAQRALEILAMQ